MAIYKRCSVCGETKPCEEFGVDRSRRDEFSHRCRECDAAKGREYYRANRDKKRAYVAEYQAKHPKPPAERFCVRCGNPALSSRHRYCAVCRDWAYLRRGRGRELYAQKPGRTKKNGYGVVHQSLRKQWAKRVTAGESFCARCGGWIRPDEPWDLGHDPFDRGHYLGPMHRACNRDTRLEKSLRRPIDWRRARAEEWL